MILDHFNLREQPFGVTPDPRFWYSSPTHREALASILYGLESKRGFVALIAHPGMGKTTVLFNGLRRLGDRMRTVFLFQQLTSAESLMQAILADLDINDREGNLTQLQLKLNDVCAEQARLGKSILVVIDEAQSLDEPVLECLRMLSNFETAHEKLIQIVLSGQPQLAEKLAGEKLVQLRQRISILAHLKPLTESETAAYIDHRLRAAGYNSPHALFTPSALAMIARESQGIPRNINNLCFNAMSVAFALNQKTIDRDMVREVVEDLRLENPARNSNQISKPAAPEPVCDTDQGKLKPPAPARPPMPEAIALFNEREPAKDPKATPNPATPENLSSAPKPVTFAAKTRWRQQTAGGYKMTPVWPAVRRWPTFQRLTAASSHLFAWRRRLRFSSAYRAAGVGLLAIAAPVLVMSLWKRDSPHVATIALRRASSSSHSASFAAPAVAPSSLPSTVTITVKAGESLEKICTEHFASCTPNLLESILDLNPDIDDPDYIEIGQPIRIPAGETAAAASNPEDATIPAQRSTP
jgi:type II secretory pathway predicted ATPase ExeA